MKNPQKPPKKPGRKGENIRAHISWPQDLLDAAHAIGSKMFGNKSAYLAHLFVKELERQGLTVVDILKLAEEWREKQNTQTEPQKTEPQKPDAPKAE